jgi:hypothetical protein
MKRNEILGEQKKGVKAVKYNKKPKDPTAEYGKAKEKLAPQKPLEEGVEDRISYQVAKVLHDHGVKYDPAREDELINVIGLALVKKLDMSPKEARAIMNDEDFLGDTMGELRHMEQGVAEGVAETLPMHDAVKVLRQYGADHFKTTSNELHFYKQGRPFSVDLIWGNEGERSVNLSQLNSATRGLKGQGVAEGYRDRRDAYQRDYDSSVSGMGKRQSQAYQDDGGANDERHDLDPTDWYFVKDGKMFAVSVYPNQEREAMSRGYSRTRIEARAKANDQDKTEAMGAEVGKITKVDPATKKATLTKADGSSMEVDSTALKPTPDGKMQMDTPDAAQLKTGTSVVSTEQSVITELDPPPNDSTSPIHGDNNHDGISKLLVHRLKRLAGL